jgi:hypothetical protein
MAKRKTWARPTRLQIGLGISGLLLAVAIALWQGGIFTPAAALSLTRNIQLNSGRSPVSAIIYLTNRKNVPLYDVTVEVSLDTMGVPAETVDMVPEPETYDYQVSGPFIHVGTDTRTHREAICLTYKELPPYASRRITMTARLSKETYASADIIHTSTKPEIALALAALTGGSGKPVDLPWMNLKVRAFRLFMKRESDTPGISIMPDRAFDIKSTNPEDTVVRITNTGAQDLFWVCLRLSVSPPVPYSDPHLKMLAASGPNGRAEGAKSLVVYGQDNSGAPLEILAFPAFSAGSEFFIGVANATAASAHGEFDILGLTRSAIPTNTKTGEPRLPVGFSLVPWLHCVAVGSAPRYAAIYPCSEDNPSHIGPRSDAQPPRVSIMPSRFTLYDGQLHSTKVVIGNPGSSPLYSVFLQLETEPPLGAALPKQVDAAAGPNGRDDAKKSFAWRGHYGDNKVVEGLVFPILNVGSAVRVMVAGIPIPSTGTLRVLGLLGAPPDPSDPAPEFAMGIRVPVAAPTLRCLEIAPAPGYGGFMKCTDSAAPFQHH